MQNLPLLHGQKKPISTELNSIRLQLRRLRYHFNNAMRSFDEIAFVDIATTLRNWAEMAAPLAKIAPEFSNALVFKSALPHRSLLKIVAGETYVIAITPSSLHTGMYPSPPMMKANPIFELNTKIQSGLLADPAGDFSVGAFINYDAQGRIEIKNPYFVGKSLGDEQKKFETCLEKTNIKRHNFRTWMTAEVVRVAYIASDHSIKMASLSREILIKRVANTLNGSHASIAIQENNKFDPAVKALLTLNFQSTPLPFFILLKISEDILHFAPRYFEN